MKETQYSPDQLKAILKTFPERLKNWKKCRLIVVGDIGLDEYVLGDVRRISPEAPVPVLDVQSEDSRLGLAANVAQNVASLGGESFLVAVVGRDSAADVLREKLRESGVSPDYLVVDDSRPTTRKLRVMSGMHHIVRVDYERKKYLSDAVEQIVLQQVEKLLKSADAVILEDYAKGTLSENTLQKIIEATHKAGKKVFLDPHRSTPAKFYRGVDVTTPNREEAVALSGLDYDELREKKNFVVEVGHAIRDRAQIENVVITRGSEGMTYVGQNEIVHMPTFARQVFDVTGAGDTAIAAMAMAYVGGLNLSEACVFANVAAGVVVGKVGCVPCTRQEFLDYNQSLIDT